MTKTFILVFGSSLLLAAGCGKKPAAPATPPPPEVSVLTVGVETVQLTTELPGRVTATREAQVRARATGILLKRHFEEGSNVKEGEFLFEIDPAPLQAALNSVMATAAKTEAALNEARARVNRYKELVEIDAVSKQVFDEAMATLRQAEAELAANKAAIENAQLNLGYAKVTAPISGRIGRALVTEGALVSATEATELARILQLDPVYLDITQSSADLLRLKNEMQHGTLGASQESEPSVTVLMEDGSRYPHAGRLLFTDVAVDPTTGMVALRALLPNPENALLPGLFARAVVVQGVLSNVVTIPQRTVGRGPSGISSVLVINGENKVEARNIRINREIGNKVIVAEGLKAGERIIVEGSQKSPPGAIVKPVPFESPGRTNQSPSAPAH